MFIQYFAVLSLDLNDIQIQFSKQLILSLKVYSSDIKI